VDVVKRNAMLNNIIEKYLAAHPAKKRPESEYEAMKLNNKIDKDMIKLKDDAPPA
jgi:hypothetical protein